MTQFWHRRTCEAVMFIAGFVIIFYFWTYFNQSMNAGILISTPAVITSTITFLIAAALYLWTPTKFILYGSLTVYAAAVTTTAILIETSGGLQSPFIALWILVAIFAGIFGAAGLFSMFVLGSVYAFFSLLEGNIEATTVITTVVAGWLPLIASFVIWHSNSGRGDGKDKAFRELASELSEVASKAEVVINAIADGVIAVDNQGVIQLINPAAQQITGWGKQDATNLSYKSVFQLTDAKDQELTDGIDPVQQVLATNKEVSTNELNLKTHSGKKLLASIIVSPVGQLGAGAIIVFRDITNEKAEERQQAEFISTASHEMRTPVASIEGYLGLVLNPSVVQIDDKTRDYITKAHESAQHLGRLFQDLLDVSRADDGRLSNKPKVVDVTHFARDIIEGLRPQADAKNLRLHFKPLSDDSERGERNLNPVFYAQVDNDHLREVIANLTENAIKYTPKGDVIIDIQGDSEHIVISVEDSGIGIPTEDIPHLFQKFYRVDNTDTREIGGTGLGLYLCRRLAEVMGGRIWVESAYQQGSTFYFELPRISHEEANRLIEQATLDAERNTDITVVSQGTPLPESPVQPPQPTQTYTPQSPAQAQVAQPATQQSQPIQNTTPQPQSQYPQPPVANLAYQPAVALNTPLTAIEQNPQQFVQQRPQGVAIPPRSGNQQT